MKVSLTLIFFLNVYSVFAQCGKIEILGQMRFDQETGKYFISDKPESIQEIKYELPSEKNYTYIPYRDHWVKLEANLFKEPQYQTTTIDQVANIKRMTAPINHIGKIQILKKSNCL